MKSGLTWVSELTNLLRRSIISKRNAFSSKVSRQGGSEHSCKSLLHGHAPMQKAGQGAGSDVAAQAG